MKATTPIMILSLTLLCSLPVQAAREARACAADAQKFCPGVKPGGGAIESCLKKNEASLSAACNEYRQEMHSKAKEFTQACTADAKKICADVKPGGGRVYACLKKNEANLSSDCKKKIQEKHR